MLKLYIFIVLLYIFIVLIKHRKQYAGAGQAHFFLKKKDTWESLKLGSKNITACVQKQIKELRNKYKRKSFLFSNRWYNDIII
jgi:hypothetical protein